MLARLFHALAAGVPLRGCFDFGDVQAGSTSQRVDRCHGGVLGQPAGQIDCGASGSGQPYVADLTDFIIVHRIGPRDDTRGPSPIGVDDVGG